MWSIIGVVAVSIVAFRFYISLGKYVPILELIALTAGLQWIIGALIEYNTPFEHYKYFMYVSEEKYMGIVVPAYTIFAFIMLRFGFKYQLNLDQKVKISQLSQYGLAFVIFGLICDVLSAFVPGSLGFFMLILSNFKFIGTIILFFSDKKIHRYMFYGALVLLLLSSLSSGYFHDFVLWGAFFFMFWALKFKPSHFVKISIFILGMITLTIIQGVKARFRMALEEGYNGNVITLFIETIQSQFDQGYYEEEVNTQELNVRLNQGWIISAIIDQVPNRMGFAEGETIKDAITASILPRFLNPNKKMAGGQENFRKYTGLELSEQTSMGLSVVGEFYANYGKGVILAMALWGWFLAWVWRLLFKRQQRNPFILFFLPLLFLQVVKAETELVVVLNHLVKSAIVVFFFLYLTRSVLKWSIYDSYEA